MLRATILVGAAALALFSLTVTSFAARVTDVSALRVLDGDVPYRDFWTMYAPGSFVTLAGAFWIFGRELIVSNVLGILTSAAAVVVFFRLVASLSRPAVAAPIALLAALAFFGTGYHDGFTSFPPALLLILLAVAAVSRRCLDPGWAWALGPGVILGVAAVYKHDVAAYAVIAAGIGTLVARQSAGARPRLAPVLALGAGAAGVVGLAAGALVAAGAGAQAWRDLVEFPLGDFRYVRPEYFPMWPRLRPTAVENAQELVLWGICNLPLLALLSGMVGVVRRWHALSGSLRFGVVFGLVAFWFHWSAAHVQLNTHAISLALWGTMVGAIGLFVSPAPWMPRVALAVLVCWGGMFVARPLYELVDPAVRSRDRDWVGLPRLHGIQAPAREAKRLRDLAASIADAAPPDAPLLFLSHRNDMNIHAESVPFWLSDRRSATAHHELHPGITDTESVQRAMLASLARQPLPVVVREHRFTDEVLDGALRSMSAHVPLGAGLIDAWVAERYEPGPRFGRYEVMRRRAGAR